MHHQSHTYLLLPKKLFATFSVCSHSDISITSVKKRKKKKIHLNHLLHCSHRNERVEWLSKWHIFKWSAVWYFSARSITWIAHPKKQAFRMGKHNLLHPLKNLNRYSSLSLSLKKQQHKIHIKCMSLCWKIQKQIVPKTATTSMKLYIISTFFTRMLYHKALCGHMSNINCQNPPLYIFHQT